MRDHGGNLDWAMAQYGGAAADWVDLSTGINPVAYPVPALSNAAWAALPTRAALQSLVVAAQAAYGTGRAVLPVAGAQAAIQLMPLLAKAGTARILGPTYNEHAASFETGGWQVETVIEADQLAGADVAVVVNPNNPDGRCLTPDQLQHLAGQVGLLVVDESFVDPVPELSVGDAEVENLVVLRSFGKFYGLAGVRLGFVIGDDQVIGRLAERAGPWPVSGMAIELGRAALGDAAWKDATIRRLRQDTARLDQAAEQAGWVLVGGGDLFRYYRTPSAAKAQEALARRHVWSRIFPYSDRNIRLGLPAPERFDQVETALRGV